MPRRNPQATQARILAAAEELFAAAGFAGTRIDAVAARSGANKRMIYHYFGDKEALFAAVLQHRLGDSPWTGEGEIGHEAARLIAWEALECNEPVAGPDRAEAIRRWTSGLETRLGESRVRAQLDPALLALVMVSARLFPLVAPRFAALIDGGRPEFEARYGVLLANLVDALASPAPTVKPRLTLRPNVSGGGAGDARSTAPQRSASEENTLK